MVYLVAVHQELIQATSAGNFVQLPLGDLSCIVECVEVHVWALAFSEDVESCQQRG